VVTEEGGEFLRLVDVDVRTPCWRISDLGRHRRRLHEHGKADETRHHHSGNSLHERPPPSRKSVPVISAGRSSPNSRITVGPTSHNAPPGRSRLAPRSSTTTKGTGLVVCAV